MHLIRWLPGEEEEDAKGQTDSRIFRIQLNHRGWNQKQRLRQRKGYKSAGIDEKVEGADVGRNNSAENALREVKGHTLGIWSCRENTAHDDHRDNHKGTRRPLAFNPESAAE